MAEAEGDQQQHEGEEHAVLALDDHALFGLEQRALALGPLHFGALRHIGARGHLFALQALAFGFVEIGHRPAGAAVDARLDAIGAQEGQQFAIGDREEEFGIAAVIVRPEAVDPDHAAAWVEQRPARIAARDRGGVEDGVELAAGPRARDIAAALDRRLAAEDVAQVEPLRAVDIHRIADAGHFAAVGRQAAGQRQRGQPQGAGDADQRQVVTRADRDRLAIDRLAAAAGDDADAQRIVAQGIAQHMRIGHHLVARDGKAGAVADRDQLLAIFADNDHAHHAARGGIDIGRLGLRQHRYEQHQQRGEKGWNASHRAVL